MQTCIVVLLVACVAAVSSAAEPADCIDRNLCGLIYNPVCAQASDGSWTQYNNKCQMENCNEVTPFPNWCYAHVTKAAECEAACKEQEVN